MAKFDLSRIRRKYNYVVGSYRSLISRIISNNSEAMYKKASRISEKNLSIANDRLGKDYKKLVVPKDLAVPRAVIMRKSVERGNLIAADLHKSLSTKLRKVLSGFTPKTGESTMVSRRGKTAGKINNKLVAEFEAVLTDTFKSYTKKDPRYGVPANVHSIAVTEVRSAVNEMKAVYMERFMASNPDAEVMKQWIHNRALSKVPRPHHMAANGKTVKASESFLLSNGAVMRYPHDPMAPASEVISCNCDYLIFARIKKGKK